MSEKQPMWYAMSKPGNFQGIVADEATGRTVAVTYDAKDAPLVAAAPRLLAALEGVIQIWDDLYSNQADPEEREAWNEAHAAVQAAKGDQP